MLQFHASGITSDAGLQPYRELDDAVGLTDTGDDLLANTRTGRNGRQSTGGLAAAIGPCRSRQFATARSAYWLRSAISSVAARPAALSGLDRLAVDYPARGARVSASLFAGPLE